MKTANQSESYNCTENEEAQGLNTKVEVTSHIYKETVHLVAFTSREAKPFQAGTGLIDQWFSDSVTRGIEYINFDHLRDSSMTSDQQGYTDFKLNFVEHECYFRDSYFRFL